MKNKLALLLASTFLLAACGGSGDTSITPTSQEPTSGVTPTSQEPTSKAPTSQEPTSHDPSKDLIIKFYLDYNHYDTDNPYYTVEWYLNRPFTKEEIGLVDPTEVPEPFYPNFIGWSRYALVDELDYLWKFGTDVVTYQDATNNVFEMFGIFVGS